MHAQEIRPEQTKRITWVLWGSFLFTICTFIAVIFIATADQEPVEFDVAIAIGLSFAAFSTTIASVALRQFLFFFPVKKGSLAPGTRDALQKYFTTHIISLVLAETVAIFGFVLGFLHAEPTYMFPFAAVSIMLVLAYYPRNQYLELSKDENADHVANGGF